MTTQKESITYTFIAPVRTGFAHLLKAQPYKENGVEKGEPRYDATFIMEPDSADLAALKKLVIAELQAAYPGKTMVPRRLTQEQVDAGAVEVKLPWSDGTKSADKAKAATPPKDQEFLRGKVALRAASKYAPALSAIVGGQIVTFGDDVRAAQDGKFHAGSYVVPHVRLNVYPAREGKPGGVSLWLNSVLFIKDGPRIGGGNNATETFKGYMGSHTAEDPGTNALDDEIPF